MLQLACDLSLMDNRVVPVLAFEVCENEHFLAILDTLCHIATMSLPVAALLILISMSANISTLEVRLRLHISRNLEVMGTDRLLCLVQILSGPLRLPKE